MATEAELNEKIEHLEGLVAKKKEELEEQKKKIESLEKEIKGLLSNWSMSQVFYDQYILFLGYEKLFDYCSGHGIKLVNCSDPTLITSIPKADFSEVIKKHHKKN